jgi:hypothetical protein
MRRLLAIAAFAALLCGTSLAADFETGEIGAVSTDCTVQRSCVQASVGNAGAAYIQVTGTFTATLEVEGTADGTTWDGISTDITAAGKVQLNVAGLRKIRLRCSAYTSGTASVAISLSPASPSPTIDVAALSVDNSGVEAKLDTTNTHLTNIDAGKLEEATFTGRVGEVQASPTANTVLGRIKSVEDKLDTLLGVVDTPNDEMQVRTEPGSVVGPAVGATFPVSAEALPLPSGAATESTLSTLNGKVPSLGQAVAGSSVPVVLPSAQQTALTPPTSVGLKATTTDGATPYSFVSVAGDNFVSVKASAGTLYSLTVINPGATKQYVRLYNKASAPDPSACSTNADCPVIYFPVPSRADSLGAGVSLPLPAMGMAFSAGLAFSISGAECTVVSTCTDETDSAAGVTIILSYK